MKLHRPISSDAALLLACCALLCGSSSASHAADAKAATPPCASKGPPPGPATQGRNLQGRNLQGRNLQGRNLQGRNLQGTQPAVAVVQKLLVRGTPVAELRLQGTTLVGSVDGKTLTGADFIGATVVQEDIDGSPLQATITNVQADPQDASCEVLLYTLTATNPETGKSEDLCEPDQWGQRYATPVYGSWDSTGAHIPSTSKFVFACTSGVIAKCIRWGYRPWKSVNGRSLADYHQACTRMARADYCGDGTSHTEDGTLIDMYDALKIQQKSPLDPRSLLLFDAAWTPKGAYCVTKDRWLNLSKLASMAACKAKFTKILPLIETSPINPLDICLVKRGDVSRSEVLIDNQSGLNFKLK
ncbi:MAG TPA: ADYC domain-containing protein [Pseudomonadota bacterium]|nr:ADYC domain-containing protein [Pseudomonadota bacterium]